MLKWKRTRIRKRQTDGLLLLWLLLSSFVLFLSSYLFKQEITSLPPFPCTWAHIHCLRTDDCAMNGATWYHLAFLTLHTIHFNPSKHTSLSWVFLERCFKLDGRIKRKYADSSSLFYSSLGAQNSLFRFYSLRSTPHAIHRGTLTTIDSCFFVRMKVPRKMQCAHTQYGSYFGSGTNKSLKRNLDIPERVSLTNLDRHEIEQAQLDNPTLTRPIV